MLKVSGVEDLSKMLVEIFKEKIPFGKLILDFLGCRGFTEDNIVVEAKTFDSKLKSLFGEGAVVLEKIVLNELYSRLNLTYEEKGDFADHIEYIKNQLTRKQKKKH
jgi:hypothetical protein